MSFVRVFSLALVVASVLGTAACVGVTGKPAAGGPASGATVTPSSVNFGNVTVGTTNTQTIRLANMGTTNLTITKISASGTGFSASGLSTPLTLPAGQDTMFTASFKPTGTGAQAGIIAISSNAAGSSLSIPMTGSGVTMAVPHSVSLSWAPSISAVLGYNVYRGSVSGGPYTRLNPSVDSLTSYADQSVSGGQTYYYVVTAIDTKNLESAFSNQASVTVPGH